MRSRYPELVVARSSPGDTYVPHSRPLLGIAPDATRAAVLDGSRVVILDLPAVAAIAELGVPGDPDVVAVEWIESAANLLVVSSHATHALAQLIDVEGPRTLAEVRIPGPVRLAAVVGGFGLMLGAGGAHVLRASEGRLAVQPFPSRFVPTAAGAAGTQFLVAGAEEIEEWDPGARVTRRRLRVPRPASITALGGSHRVVWYTTRSAPTQLDVLPLVNRGQPRLHTLPEPLATVRGHPQSDFVVCRGAASGTAYVLDLDGRSPMRVLSEAGDDLDDAALAVGRSTLAVLARAGHPLAVVPIVAVEATSPVAPGLVSVLLSSPRAAPLVASHVGDHEDPGEIDDPSSLAPTVRYERADAPLLDDDDELEPASVVEPSMAEDPRWREDLVEWARDIVGGADPRPPPPTATISVVAERFGVSIEVEPAVRLLYAVGLLGQSGATPYDVARLLGGNWAEAVGRGELAATRIAEHVDARIRLHPAARRAIDGVARPGVRLVGEAGGSGLFGPCAIVDDGASRAELARRCRRLVGGAVLVVEDGFDTDEAIVEARARGAVPLIRAACFASAAFGRDPVLIIVDSAAEAERIGVPLLG